MAAVVELLPTQNKIVDNSIFCWLTPQQVCMVSQANQALRLAGPDPDLWRSLYDAHWTPRISSTHRLDSKEHFRLRSIGASPLPLLVALQGCVQVLSTMGTRWGSQRTQVAVVCCVWLRLLCWQGVYLAGWGWRVYGK